MEEKIVEVIMTCAPALASIIGCVISVIKMQKNNQASLGAVTKEMSALKETVTEKKQYSELRAELRMAHQENRELQKKLDALIKWESRGRYEAEQTNQKSKND